MVVDNYLNARRYGYAVALPQLFPFIDDIRPLTRMGILAAHVTIDYMDYPPDLDVAYSLAKECQNNGNIDTMQGKYLVSRCVDALEGYALLPSEIETYVCDQCNARNRKLFRPLLVSPDKVKPVCGVCLNICILHLETVGTSNGQYYVAHIPNFRVKDYWGTKLNWWLRLPLR